MLLVMRLNDIEFRYSETNKRYELIQWVSRDIPNRPFCISIAYFERTSDGYDMITVGDRFFQDEDAWKIGQVAMQFMNVLFKEDQEAE